MDSVVTNTQFYMENPQQYSQIRPENQLTKQGEADDSSHGAVKNMA